MINVVVKHGNKIIEKSFKSKILISDVLENLNMVVNKPCGGNGTCGKCKILACGELSTVTENERMYLNTNELSKGYRLACTTFLTGKCEINYEEHSKDINIVSSGIMPHFNKNPIVSKEKCFGVAIDIGTTTIAAYLYEFPSCKLVKSVCVKNMQVEHGSDVISRIEYCESGGLQKLNNTILNQLEEISRSFDVNINTYVITGNTVMLHFLKNLDATGIAVSPFTPKSLFGEWYDNVYLPKCISSYVGADITTAILASDMLNDNTSLLIDIGTNGEMALFAKNKLVCCSTAAGPVFEGANIVMGSIAMPGAIDKVYIENNEICYTTINNEKAISICGSGIIDLVACLLELEILENSGYMEEKFEIASSGVYIHPHDIRQVQLAKSSIRSGMDTLIYESGISYEHIENVYLAGGFGSFIDKNSSSKIGLIPNELRDKVVIIGNAAGIGASMILQSKECLEKSEYIANIAETIELSSSAVFMERYIDNMMFMDC